jgi:hypothetical protein
LDSWSEDKPLGVTYSVLFELCSNKKISVHEVWNEGWVIHFKINRQGIVKSQWYELAAKLNNVTLNETKDLPIWKWNANKQFSVKSVYEHLTRDDAGMAYKRVWKAKIPEKINIFMWLIEQKVVLTKGNMIWRKWQGSPDCYLCGGPKCNDHLFFSCQ